jgi:hypothetical protein
MIAHCGSIIAFLHLVLLLPVGGSRYIDGASLKIWAIVEQI